MTNKQLPRWLIGIGVPLTIVTCVLAVRMVWEQTVLTWNLGPQMIGFSLMHSGAGLLLWVSFVVASLWFVVTLVLVGVRRNFGGKLGLVTISVCAASLAVILLPYSWWQIAFASRLAQGPYAADFLATSAARGEQRVVKALLANGVDIHARTRNGSTALHAAALSGQLKLVELLIASRADINAVNRYGDSPLTDAESTGQEAVAEFLRAHGARVIRGTDQQRERASREIVREQMDRSD
jgi:hypothetical protein